MVNDLLLLQVLQVFVILCGNLILFTSYSNLLKCHVWSPLSTRTQQSRYRSLNWVMY